MSVDDASVQQSASPQRGLLARHPLISFILAYAGLWLTWMPLVLSEEGVGLLPYNLRSHLLATNVRIYRA